MLKNRWRLAGLVLLSSCASALAGGDEGTPYYGDLGQAIASILIFLGLFLILRKWAWKPICAQLQQREEDIAESISKARQGEQEAQDLMHHYKSRMEAVHAEAAELLAQAKREAASSREEVLELARSEAQKSLQHAREEIAQAQAEAFKQMQATTAKMATELASKLLETNLTEQDHERMVQQSIREIESRKAGEHS